LENFQSGFCSPPKQIILFLWQTIEEPERQEGMSPLVFNFFHFLESSFVELEFFWLTNVEFMDGIGGLCGRDFTSKDEKFFIFDACSKTAMGFRKTSFGVYSFKVEDFFHFKTFEFGFISLVK
jgi:hypothetical protein